MDLPKTAKSTKINLAKTNLREDGSIEGIFFLEIKKIMQ